jgi:hypothetical protein
MARVETALLLTLVPQELVLADLLVAHPDFQAVAAGTNHSP